MLQVHHCQLYEYVPAGVTAMAYSIKSNTLAVARQSEQYNSIELWNVKDAWFNERTFSTGLEGVQALAWGDDDRLFSATAGGDIREHNIVTGRIKRTVPGNNGPIWCMASNEDKSKLAVGTEDGRVVIFDIFGGVLEFARAFDQHITDDPQDGRIWSLAWYEQHNSLVTGGVDNIRVYDVSTGHACHTISLKQEAKEKTNVFAIGVARDFHIVSGDSQGKVTFWDGKQGVRIRELKTHKADVLCLAVSPNGKSVFAGGIDHFIQQFDLVSVDLEGKEKRWIASTRFPGDRHTHDIKAMIMLPDRNRLVSAGTDCTLAWHYISNWKDWRGYHAVPHKKVVHYANEVMQFQYPSKLELWRTAKSDQTAERSGVELLLSRAPKALLQMNLPAGRTVLTSAIAADASRMAYINDNMILKLYYLETTGEEEDLSFKKIDCDGVKASCVAFSPADPNTVVTTSMEGNLQIIKVTETTSTLTDGSEGVSARKAKVICTLPLQTEQVYGASLLSVCPRGRYVAVADHDHNVHIYSVEEEKGAAYKCSMPRSRAVVTAMAFHPTEALLAVVTADKKLLEFDIEEEAYTSYSREFVRQMHQKWKQREYAVTQIFYHPTMTHKILLRDAMAFYVLDKKLPLPETSSKHRKRKIFRENTQFKYIMGMELMGDKEMLLMERPDKDITACLPPPFKRKKFGH